MITRWMLVALAGCGGPTSTSDRGPEDRVDADTDADADADTDTDTDPPEVPTRAVTASLHDAQASDEAGHGLWIGDLDHDGVDEVLVGAPAEDYGAPRVQSAVYLLREPFQSGELSDLAASEVRGWHVDDLFGYRLAGIAVDGLVAIGAHASGKYDYPVYLYDAAATGVQRADSWVARIHVPDLYNFPLDLADCTGVWGTGAALCVSGNAGSTVDEGDMAGRTLLFDGPFTGTVQSADARTELIGDPWDQAVVLEGGADLDGDGRNDLVIGAIHAAAIAGRVALVIDPPEGSVNLWSVGFPTLTGTAAGGELGLGLAVGDLDGDGYGDVLAGAPIVEDGAAHVFLGPFAGDRTADSADVTVEGTRSGQWTGYSAAIADLDGDGSADLAVGQPWSVSTAAVPGRVMVFDAPAAGTWVDEDATVRIQSPST
ncbi:MAG: FG-GAP-like repeat-containing protein, partial [Myxococcota bacterium]